ncbi:unnamed protein product [Lepeophtheirus salmonis]|uniref:(salmon louse) hypothetical protein n=1 Tax=Lepeophtheirus salmonis TaxID=72036 RepID=A0A7R8H7W2_LEPSM|nr:unnamed protein product [Lepeophtheirus salmonis]CAF2928169.1 unnamed protein product [Lepeophtheirus salmonis]
MNSAKSFQRHRMDIINILNAFSEKYIHKLDRSFVDRLLNDGKRLVGDLNDLELEYLGFSLANQLIWASFSSHNTFLRTWDNKDAYLNAEGRGRMDRSAGNRKIIECRKYSSISIGRPSSSFP